MVFKMAFYMPNRCPKILMIGPILCVEQLPQEKMLALPSCELTPCTTVGVYSLFVGPAIRTVHAPAAICFSALSRLVNSPVLSITTSMWKSQVIQTDLSVRGKARRCRQCQEVSLSHEGVVHIFHGAFVA